MSAYGAVTFGLCPHCGNTFMLRRGEPVWCPACGSTDVDEAVWCDGCGEPVPVDDVIQDSIEGHNLCELCAREEGIY